MTDVPVPPAEARAALQAAEGATRTCSFCGYTDQATPSGVGALGLDGEWRYWMTNTRCWRCREGFDDDR